MGMLGVLFNPKGRINARKFWQGVIVIVGILVILNVLSIVAPPAIAAALGGLVYLLPYPYLCVYGKRFHDNGRTAWLFVPILLLFIILLIAVVFSAPGMSEFFSAYSDLAASQDSEGLEALAEETFGGTDMAIRSFGFIALFNLLFGFLVARLESDPDENEHGMPTSGGTADTFS